MAVYTFNKNTPVGIITVKITLPIAGEKILEDQLVSVDDWLRDAFARNLWNKLKKALERTTQPIINAAADAGTLNQLSGSRLVIAQDIFNKPGYKNRAKREKATP